MPLVKIVKNKSITEILTDYSITAIEMNVLVALRRMDGEAQILDLIECIRKSNPTSYKFVDDRRFYNAVARLTKRKYVTYN